MAHGFLNGIVTGAGIVAVLAVAFLVAWAGDVLTVDKDGTVKFAVSDAGKITVGATESYVNLVIQNNAAAATNKVDITAVVLTVEGVRLENVNVSADITAPVGAGGRDTNFADAVNTWYYVWVIANNDGTQKNGILTLAPATPNPPTAPVLPSGYTKYRRVGAVRNNASADFLQFVQEGNKCVYAEPFSADLILVNGGSATAWTELNATSCMPPTSRRGAMYNQINAAHGTVGTALASRLRGKAAATTYGNLSVGIVAQVVGVECRNDIAGDVQSDAAQRFEYMLSTAPSSGGAAIYVLGYVDRI